MIKGSTKVGEIFLCGPETDGKLEVLSQFLGKAITGLGGGCKKMYVIEGKCFSFIDDKLTTFIKFQKATVSSRFNPASKSQ